MNYKGEQITNKWQKRIRFVPSVYEFLALGIASFQIFIFRLPYFAPISSPVLISALGIYSLLKSVRLVRGYQTGILQSSLLIADIVICILLMFSTGGLYSPFLLYTITPVLAAALFLEVKLTFIVAGLSGVYVIGSYLYNPLLPAKLSLAGLTYFSIYMLAVSFTAILPYLVNAKIRQGLQSESIVQERRRFSREIHDGIAQTLTGLRWQVQILRHRLAEMGIKLDEANQLEKMVDEAYHDSRESLELLRNYVAGSSFLTYIRDSLERVKEDTKINFQIDAEKDGVQLDSAVDVELRRICQEALTNVRKHSGAHNVYVAVSPVNNHLKVNIADDGRGFDALAFYNDGVEAKGHGLTVMHERAASVGGKLRVISLPGHGTEIQLEMPVSHHKGRSLW